MSFQFDFSGDDIEEVSPQTTSASSHEAAKLDPAQTTSVDPAFEATLYKIEDLLPEKPMRISFENVEISLQSGDSIHLARRDLYDIKYQLMKQDNLDATEKIVLKTNQDIQTSTYEGGLKIWECTIDLVRYLDAHVVPCIDKYTTILEMGCGAGWPSAYLFAKLLRLSDNDLIQNNRDRSPTTLILADYNKTVLKLGTIMNLLLTWRLVTQTADDEGEVDLTLELMNEFVQDLKRRSIELKFISGGWSPQFVDLVGPSKCDLILASETVYSPDSIPAFTKTLLDTLNPTTGQALVASKMVYFGVGGGVAEFSNNLTALGAYAETVSEDREGVGRVILRVNK